MTSDAKKVIFDVGMHKGEDTDYYLKKGFKVVSFEADPDLANFCRKRFAAEIEAGLLQIVEGAIVDAATAKASGPTIDFFKNKDESVWGTVVGDWADRNVQLGTNSEIITVDVVDFSECLRKYGVPYYMKIDIEGMDTVCLQSLLDVEGRPSYISIESEKVSFEKLEGEFDLFTRLGYNQFQLINQAKVSSFSEPKQSKEGGCINYRFLEGATGLFGQDLAASHWKNLATSLSAYKKVFRAYDLFGDHGKYRKYWLGRLFIKAAFPLFKYPGWYDTHAKHSSVE